jgi:hypothetical protein
MLKKIWIFSRDGDNREAIKFWTWLIGGVVTIFLGIAALGPRHFLQAEFGQPVVALQKSEPLGGIWMLHEREQYLLDQAKHIEKKFGPATVITVDGYGEQVTDTENKSGGLAVLNVESSHGAITDSVTSGPTAVIDVHGQDNKITGSISGRQRQ